MDWFSDRGKFLKSFCKNNNLINFISKPTRVQRNKNGATSSTLIDFVLHNNNNIKKQKSLILHLVTTKLYL